MRIVGLISSQCLYFLSLLCSWSPPRTSHLLAKWKEEERAGSGIMALDLGVTMTRALLIQLRSCSCGFFSCMFFPALHQPWKLWVRVTLPSGVWLENVKNKHWKRMGSQNWSSLQRLHPQIWWNLNGRCTPHCLHFFNLLALTLCIQSLPFIKPCWSLHLLCRSLVPAALALLVMKLSTSQVPYLWLACEWTPSIVAAPSSSGLGKSLRKDKKISFKCVSACVAMLYHSP